MKVRLSSDKRESEADNSQTKPDLSWVEGLAAAVFVWAFIASLYHHSNDLRTPLVLVIDALLATAVAVGYAIHERLDFDLRGISRCFAFGLWSAAVFRLAPMIANESVLFDAQGINFDIPYILLFAAVRGFIVVLAVWPFAKRVLQDRSLELSVDEKAFKIGIAAVVVFYVVVTVVLFATTNLS
ncbi:MAG: hypothetical protein GTO55_03420 [Armatimonadetes bacterium]|nr:hypothetical protein [Armatimonadota bacterium]NIM23325.1 hypothetical protein [Armatimonadota bacterium]NIM67189.1 hypothetical protein [Armatimonadota bacterium]NIM75714.1 hypothetical protein [Armatimonadota bacterium]NIN05378.1 hypothetical protein [Armatimonadota bacterium]